MTTQAPDELVNNHPRVKLRGLYLYGVIRGDTGANHGWGERYLFTKPPQPPKDVPRCSALWRGYVATFRLDEESRLELVSYRYPLSLTRSITESVGEVLIGDFWLLMKHNFSGPRTYVAFKDGRLVEDESAWVVEDARSRWKGPGSEPAG